MLLWRDQTMIYYLVGDSQAQLMEAVKLRGPLKTTQVEGDRLIFSPKMPKK